MSNISLKKKSKMYECQAFFSSGYPKMWKYVTDLESFSKFLSRDHGEWKYFNVYEKGTKTFLKRFYPGNAIPKVLSLLLLVGLCFHNLHIPMKNTFNKTTSTTSINGIYYYATIPKLYRREGVC
jgi:hypothetical protein